MNWKQWTAVAVAIGGGILLQIAVPMDRMDMAGAGDAGMHHGMTQPAAAGAGEAAPESGPYRTVALQVTGMT